MQATAKNKTHSLITEIVSTRKATGISQKILAMESGLVQPRLSALETGKSNNPFCKTVDRLWEALGRLIPVERLAEFPKALATDSAQQRLGVKSKKAKRPITRKTASHA